MSTKLTEITPTPLLLSYGTSASIFMDELKVQVWWLPWLGEDAHGVPLEGVGSILERMEKEAMVLAWSFGEKLGRSLDEMEWAFGVNELSVQLPYEVLNDQPRTKGRGSVRLHDTRFLSPINLLKSCHLSHPRGTMQHHHMGCLKGCHLVTMCLY